jgi:DNA-binding NtrC family response regulator
LVRTLTRCRKKQRAPHELIERHGEQMATQAINYKHQEGKAVHSLTPVDEVPRPIRDRLIGSSRWAKEARRLVAAYAARDHAVVLEGEPGTGKRLLAGLIHQCSPYREGPFVSLALGSTSDELARALLFGWTGARSDDVLCSEKGLIELAREGTLYIHGGSSGARFLTDDIIRFVERRGRSARIIIGRGNRSSAFYRPTASVGARRNGWDYERIQLPALRQRPDDIEPLAVHFIEQRCRQVGKELRAFSSDTMRAMRCYDWPQNVRELRTLVNHLVKQSNPPPIDVSLLPAYLAGSRGASALFPAVGLDLDNEVKRYEIDLISAALTHSHGLQNKAAQLLGIKATTLFMRIRRYGINVADFK